MIKSEDKIMLEAMEYIIYKVFANSEEDKWENFDIWEIEANIGMWREEMGFVWIAKGNVEITLYEFKTVFTHAWRKVYDGFKDVVPSDLEHIYNRESWSFKSIDGRLW